MSDDEIRDEIGKYCGWIYAEVTGEVVFTEDGEIVGIPWPSLDAMHMAEVFLESHQPGLCLSYATILECVISPTGMVGDFWLVNATFDQRSEAFLKTIGKWVD